MPRQPDKLLVHMQNLWELPTGVPRVYMDRKGYLYRWKRSGLTRRKWFRFKGKLCLRLTHNGDGAMFHYGWAIFLRDNFGTPCHWNGKTMLPGHSDRIPPDAPGY